MMCYMLLTTEEMWTSTIFPFDLLKHNPAGFPRYEELKDVYAVKAFIEQSIKTKQEFADL